MGMETSHIKFYGDFIDLEYVYITANKHDSDYVIFGKTLHNKFMMIDTLTIKNAGIYDGTTHVSTLQLYSKTQRNLERISILPSGYYFMSEGLHYLKCNAIYKFILN
jgi:hypothetical protein